MDREENLTYSLEEKSDFVRAILENSILKDREFYGLITEVLMQIPEEALEKIDLSLDHIATITKNNFAATESIRFTCMGKHETQPLWQPRQKNQTGKPSEVEKPIYAKKYVIILEADSIKKLTKTHRLTVIAEEFAHVYLQHNNSEVSEKAAETQTLVESWGFKPFPHIRQRGTSALVQARDFKGN